MIRLSQSDSTESTVGDEKSKGSGWFRNVIQSTGGEKMWKASAFTLDFDDFVPTCPCRIFLAIFHVWVQASKASQSKPIKFEAVGTFTSDGVTLNVISQED